MRRNILTILAITVALAACAGPPRVDVPVNAPPFSLEGFFAGRTVGTGGFTSAIAGIDRRLTVRTTGRWDGKTLTLVEDFLYADGERDRKTWRFTKIAPGRYTGTREDVVGTADVVQDGNTVKLTYTADLPSKDGSTTRLTFADVIAPIDGRRAVNRATVSRFGIPVASVDLVFTRER